MSEQKNKTFFWIEGVFRREVEHALSANRYPALYQQPVRRTMVALYAALSIVLALAQSIGTDQTFIYIATVTAVLLVTLFIALRLSVRLIADAPSELLDERLVAIRDRTYLSAYRWLSLIFGVWVGMAIHPDFSLGDPWWPTVGALAMIVAGLPSMILAWRLPSERSRGED